MFRQGKNRKVFPFRTFMANEARIRLGVLTRPHSLQGGLRCALDYPESPTIAVPCTVDVGFSESFTSPYELVSYEPGRGEIICYFRGIDDRDKAAELADKALFLSGSAVSYGQTVANPGLIGFEVRDEEENHLGNIVRIFQTPAHYIWTVEENGRDWMLPAIDEFVLEIDEEKERIVVRLIPGLRDEEQEIVRDDT